MTIIGKKFKNITRRLNRQQREIDRLKLFSTKYISRAKTLKVHDIVTVLTFDSDGKIWPYEFITSEKNPVDYERVYREMEEDGKIAAIIKHKGKDSMIINPAGNVFMAGKGLLSYWINDIRAACKNFPVPPQEPEKPAWKPEVGGWAWCTFRNENGPCKILDVRANGEVDAAGIGRRTTYNKGWLRPLTLDDLKKTFGITE